MEPYVDSKPSKPRFQNPFFVHDNDQHMCGLFGWKPRWLQRCNNMKVFMMCYVLLGIFHGMMSTYFGSVLPSIEKRFGFSSESIGVVKSMNDISHLLTALFVAHYGGSGAAHRPRWIAVGSFVIGVALLLMAAPEILFPVDVNSILGRSLDEKQQMCVPNSTVTTPSKLTCSLRHETNLGPLIVFGVAEFLIGLGSTTSIILGLPFVDDQVSHLNTPIYFALSLCGRIFGPLIGLGLGAVFNAIYLNFSHPQFRQTDPRWISAWYVGFLISGLGVCLFGLTLGCFPSQVPESSKNEPTRKDEDEETKKDLNVATVEKIEHVPKAITLKDLPRNLKRLAVNGTFMLKLLSQLINAFVISAYMTFSSKFMKEQYLVPQSTVALAGGFPPVFAGFVATLIGSVIIKRFKFRPIQVVYMMVLSSVVGAVCYFSVIALGCDMERIVGVDDVQDPYDLGSAANFCPNNRQCNCASDRFSPICDRTTMTTYVSPCVAGCQSSQKINMTTFYLGCACTTTTNSTQNSTTFSKMLSRTSSRRAYPSRVVTGLCPKTCPNFTWYVVAMTIAKFFMAIPMAGMLMLQFRIVDRDLKSLGNAVMVIVMSAFGFLPAPIVAGRLIDSSCRLWQRSACGTQGACWLYNADDFRWKLHVAIGGVRIISMILDSMIGYRVRHLTFDRDADESLNRPDLQTSASTMAFVTSVDNDGEAEVPAMILQDIRRGSRHSQKDHSARSEDRVIL